MRTEQYKLMARVGYFSLLVLIPLWNLWISPPPLSLNPWLITCIWFTPLLFPMRGILCGDPYTFAWSGFLGIFYSMHALVVIYSAFIEHIIIELQLAIIELIVATLFLIGSLYYAKYKGQELGLSIRKKSKKK